jgi:histidyl-tRNA synthetase
MAGVNAAGVDRQLFKLDVSIARGLDYYTGTVCETFLDALPTIGSVCSGGRYDNLAGLYTKQELPGIGASLGLDRLLAAMEELQLIEKVGTPAEVFIPFFDKKRLHDYLRLANDVRTQGIGVEVYPEPKKLGQQLKYADRRGFRVALIAGDNEFAERKCQVKDLQTGNAADVSLEEGTEKLVDFIRAILSEKTSAAVP